MSRQKVVIMGAGVIGLTIAHILTSESDPTNNYGITIIARDMPEDMDSQGWASPWAGANWGHVDINEKDPRIKKWEAETFNKLWDMIPTGLVKALPSRIFSLMEDEFADVWYKDIPRGFRALAPDEVPAPYRSGIAYTTISVSPLVYLPWLKSQLESRSVTFIQKRLRNIEEAAELAGPDGIVVNALSMGARSLVGIEDTAMYPIRGQTILVQAPHCNEFLNDTTVYANDGVCYIIPRPGEEGTILLGGTYQEYNWDTSYNKDTAQEIFARCALLEPKLLDTAHVRILNHNVGLRPAREGGPRVEVEIITLPLAGELVPRVISKSTSQRKLKVVHAYGFGPAGYQRSWGAAEEAVNILKSIEKSHV